MSVFVVASWQSDYLLLVRGTPPLQVAGSLYWWLHRVLRPTTGRHQVALSLAGTGGHWGGGGWGEGGADHSDQGRSVGHVSRPHIPRVTRRGDWRPPRPASTVTS